MGYPKKNPGDPLRLPARDWNYLLEMADLYRRERGRSVAAEAPGGYQPMFGLIRNDTGADRERFDVVGIDDALVTPTDDLPTFLRQAAFAGVAPDTSVHKGAWAVLLEPLAAAGAGFDGGIGLAIIAGEAVVGLVPPSAGNTWDDMQTAGKTFAEIVNAEYTLTAGASGSARILWTEDANQDGEDWRWARVRIGNSVESNAGVSGTVKVCDSSGTTVKTLTITNGLITGIA